MRYPNDPAGYSDKTDTVTAVEDKGRAKLVTVSESFTINWQLIGLTSPGLPDVRAYDRPDAKYLVSADGVYLTSQYDTVEKKWEDYDRPPCQLKLPAKPGDTWTNEQPAKKYKETTTIGKPERVKVSAGTYDAIVLHVEGTHEGKPVPRRTFWYARGVGLVKSLLEGKVGMELISFNPGKK